MGGWGTDNYTLYSFTSNICYDIIGDCMRGTLCTPGGDEKCIKNILMETPVGKRTLGRRGYRYTESACSQVLLLYCRQPVPFP
jgi:hypothetical protein